MERCRKTLIQGGSPSPEGGEPSSLARGARGHCESEARHAKKAVATGAAGIFLAIANAQDGILSEADYAKFSEPFDRMILQAVNTAPLNTLHLHGDKVYLQRFFKGWPAAAINYSAIRLASASLKSAGNTPNCFWRDLMK